MSLRRNWSDEPSGPLVTPWHLFGRDSRIVTLFGNIFSSIEVPAITTESVPFLAEETVGSLMLLEQESHEPVKIIINNGGGSVAAGFMIIQGMEHLQVLGVETEMLVWGSSMSMASIVLAAGTIGKRYALERSTIHFHSGKANSGGTPEDKERIDEYIKRTLGELHLVLARRTKIPEYYAARESYSPQGGIDKEENRVKAVQKFLGGETFLSSEQALEAGVIDEVLKAGDERIREIFKLKPKPKGDVK